MAGQIFAIRPQPGLGLTIALASKAGLEVRGEALFEIRPAAWQAPVAAGIDALLIGSANAIRHGGPQLAQFAAKPVHAVGKSTAAIAQAAGFQVSQTGTGGLQALLDDLDGDSIRFLRLAGAERVPLAIPPHVQVTERIVYQAEPLAMSAKLAQLLANGGVVMLHSAAAARHFHAECTRHGVDLGGISLATLGPRISAAALTGWAEIRHAARPDETALLALVKDMCQGRSDSLAT